MGRKTEKIVVDTKVYSVEQYKVTDGMVLWGHLQKSFGKALGTSVDAFVKGFKGYDSERGIASVLDADIQVAPILDSLFEKIEPEQLPKFAEMILQGTQIQDGEILRPVILDIDFAGNYLHLIKTLKEILMYQYSDIKTFFLSLAGAIKNDNAPQAEPRIKAKSL